MDALLTSLEEWDAEQRRRDAERLCLLADLHESALGRDPQDVESTAGPVSAGNEALAEPGDHAADAPSTTPSRGGGSEISFRSLRAQLAMACGVSEHAAARDLDLAYQARHSLPATLDALRGGTLSLQHARIIAEYANIFHDVTAQPSDERSVDEQLADAALRRGAYEQDAVRIAARETPNRFRPIARRLAAMYAVKTLAERHQEAVRRRHVRIVELDDGMAELTALLPAEEAHEIYDRLTRLAKRAQARVPEEMVAADPSRPQGGPVRPSDPTPPSSPAPAEGSTSRSRDEVRADVFADLLVGRNAGEYAGIQGRVQVIAPGSVVGIPGLKLPDHSPIQGTLTAAPVAELIGYGPIDLDTARRIAGSAARWEEVRVTIDGQVMHTDTYAPTAAQRRYLSARDQHCRTPGCRVPVHRCDIDHTVDAARGGPTRIDNLAHLCRSHHVLKHHSDWSITQHDGGDITWTDPTGRTYRDRPPSRVRFVPVVDPPSTSRPEKAQPRQARPESARPESAQPGSVQPGPVQPESAQPGLVPPRDAGSAHTAPGICSSSSGVSGSSSPADGTPVPAKADSSKAATPTAPATPPTPASPEGSESVGTPDAPDGPAEHPF